MGETLKFSNVTIYRRGYMFGITRTDCRDLTITTGVRYAQYDDATKLEWIERGKRKRVGCILDGHKPWLRVVNTAEAIEPQSPLEDVGGGTQRSRYLSCDPRWVTDFEDQLATAGVVAVFAIGQGERPEPGVRDTPDGDDITGDTHDRETCPDKTCTGSKEECGHFPTTTDRINMARAASEAYAEADSTTLENFIIRARFERGLETRARNAARRADYGARNLFIGVYPTGLVYADKSIEREGDYHRVAFLPYNTLELKVYDFGSPLLQAIRRDAHVIQARRGELFGISTSGKNDAARGIASGQTVRLGGR